MALSLLKLIDAPWEQARGALRTDLLTIESTVNALTVTANTRWTGVQQKANTVVNAGSVGSKYGFDLSTGLWFLATLTANLTVSFLNPTDGLEYRLYLRTGVGNFTVSWPSTVKWTGGSAPTITTTANKTDVISLKFVSLVNTFFGTYDQNY